MKIAIIGAGFSGSHIYHLLKKDGHDVKIFEKSRGAGGRCSTRYINDKLIDHGTAFFEANNQSFKDFCQLKVEENILIKNENSYYPTNGINKLCSSMINDLDFIKNRKILSAKKINNFWVLTDENNVKYENFDKLIITIPVPQLLQMDIQLDNTIVEQLKNVKYNSIATIMVYSHTLQNIMNPKLINDKSFKKVVDNSSKYEFSNFSSYVIHLNEELTNQQNFNSKDEVEKFTVKKVFDISGIDLKDEFHIVPHFWKYAFVKKSLEEDYIYDSELSLGLCGDYFNGSNLEGAYLSSKRLYEKEFR